MLKKRYSNWFEDYVFDMNEEQKKFLIEKGFEIKNFKEKKYQDGITRDIPNKIEDNQRIANIQFNHRYGYFYIQIKKQVCENPEDVDNLIQIMTEFSEIIEKLKGMM